jgi:hypothetical protein
MTVPLAADVYALSVGRIGPSRADCSACSV